MGNLSFASQGDFKLDKIDEHQKKASYLASGCKNFFKSEINFNRPIQNGDQQLDLNQSKEYKRTFTRKLKSFGQRQLGSHIDMVFKKLPTYKCQVCNKSFGYKQYLQRHIKTVHKKLTPYQCQECKTLFGHKGLIQTLQ